MLFNSPAFLFYFLPLVWVVFAALKTYGKFQLSLYWLLGASIFFYGWWNPPYLALLIGSILFNFFVGKYLQDFETGSTKQKLTLWAGVGVNLAVLGYFKYADFFIQTAGAIMRVHDLPILNAVLPLAISFFTFQQIAYLVDVAKGKIQEKNLPVYALFVSFFPQLIAGPIVHHKELVPQLLRHTTQRVASSRFLALGITLFAIGLFKKVILADILAIPADALNSAIQKAPETVSQLDAWIGTIAFSFQIYFDFSGYSDMAIGLGLLFGIILPINFFSPYMAGGIADFWRRWHITLSHFLRDYIYIPLGGNRYGKALQFSAILVTMLLGGLWHGAGWTFIFWGGAHGFLIIASHVLAKPTENIQRGLNDAGRSVFKVGRVFTSFVIITLLWVLFRAENLQAAGDIWARLFNGDGATGSLNLIKDHKVMVILVISGFVVWALPNSMMFTHLARRHKNKDLLFTPPIDILRRHLLKKRGSCAWVPSIWYAIWVAGIIFASILLMYSTLSQEFIYFDF